AAAPARRAGGTPCATSAPSGSRRRRAETRAANPAPRSGSPPLLPSRPRRTRRQPASPTAPRPGDRSPSPGSGGPEQPAYDPKTQATWRGPPTPFESNLVNQPLTIEDSALPPFLSVLDLGLELGHRL